MRTAAEPCTCGRPSAVYLAYGKEHLCVRCFARLVEKRVRTTIRKHGLIRHHQRVGVCVSGGKDSATALHLMHRLYRKRSDLELVAITVDEGIAGYREHGIAACRENCARFDVPHHVFTFREAFGITMDDVAKADDELGPCTYCGVLRRRLLNSAARELGVDVLVLGHNADDEAQSVLMNLLRGDDRRLTNMGPVPPRAANPAWVPRVRPLRALLERETTAYAVAKDLTMELGECPHVPRAFRVAVRDMLKDLEHQYPGTTHTVVRTSDRLVARLRENDDRPPATACSSCGEPSSGDPCMVCSLLERVHVKCSTD